MRHIIDVYIFNARTIQALDPQIRASVVSPAIIGKAGINNGLSRPLLVVVLALTCIQAVCAGEANFSFDKVGRLFKEEPVIPRPGPYFTCLVKMDNIHDFPHDYALYFSTDHHGGEGGIWLYVCSGSPTESGNWRSYDQAVADGEFDYLHQKPKANPIFIDRVQGRQTETPHLNVIDRIAYMTYHNQGAGHGQSTLLATSEDGINFSRIHGEKNSVILDYVPGEAPGDGHTGYFRWGKNPFPGIKHKYIGYSLHGGGRNYFMAMWASDDALTWEKQEVFVPIESHAIEENKILIWSQIDPNSITPLGNGEFAAITAGGTRSAGGSPRVTELFQMFIAADGKTVTRKSRKLLAVGPPGADDGEELAQPTTVRIGDEWHLIYVGAKDKARVNTILAARGRFDRDATLPDTLSQESGRRHFYRGK